MLLDEGDGTGYRALVFVETKNLLMVWLQPGTLMPWFLRCFHPGDISCRTARADEDAGEQIQAKSQPGRRPRSQVFVRGASSVSAMYFCSARRSA